MDGLRVNKKFIHTVSGKSLSRPQLDALIQYVREGDTVLFHSMDRLAITSNDFRKLVNQLTAQQVKIQCIKENLTFTGEDSAMSQLLLSVMGAFAEFERKLIKERQMEGITLAKNFQVSGLEIGGHYKALFICCAVSSNENASQQWGK